LQLSAAGANVVISARREEALHAVKAKCGGVGSGPVHVVPLDVTDSDAVTKAVDTVVGKHFAGSGLDLLILNAGKSQRVPAMDTDIQVTRELMKLNYESLVEMTQKVITSDRWMEKGRGHIAVTSSVAGKLPVALSSSYSASKAAVNAYFSSLRSELRWLRVDIVCPGPIATPIAANAAVGSAASSELLQNESTENKMPVSRFARLMLSGLAGPSSIFYETWISEQPLCSSQPWVSTCQA